MSSRVYLKAEVTICLDTDLESVDDIMDSIDIKAVPCDDNVEVYDCEVTNFSIIDAK